MHEAHPPHPRNLNMTTCHGCIAAMLLMEVQRTVTTNSVPQKIGPPHGCFIEQEAGNLVSREFN